MRLAPIVEQLKGAGFTRVYGALELAGLQERPARLPAFFVLPEGWEAAPNRTIGVHDQRTQEDFGVVVMLDGAARSEDRVSDDIHEQEKRVVAAIAGWRHPDASRACEALGGRLLSVSGSALSWIVRFRTGGHIRKEAS